MNPFFTTIVLIWYCDEEYWKALLTGTSLGSTKINDILRVVHVDIVKVWNLENPKNPRRSKMDHHVNVWLLHPYRNRCASSPILEPDRPQVYRANVQDGVGVGARHCHQ